MKRGFHFGKRRRWQRHGRLCAAGTHRVRFLEPALLVGFVLLMARPVAKDPTNIASLRARRAQEFVDQLRTELTIRNEIQIAVVVYHPLVFSVQPIDIDKTRYLMTMELGFLLMLKDDELRAAIAHELGHVWIYTHHPFLSDGTVGEQYRVARGGPREFRKNVREAVDVRRRVRCSYR
jgi:hypothetical protein